MVACNRQDVRLVGFLVVSILVGWSFFMACVTFMVIDVCVLLALGSGFRWR